MPKLRAAAISYLNTWPLTVGLEGSRRIEVVKAVPSGCATMLESGEVDLALVPVGAIAGKDYEIVPGLAIGCDGPVQTVLLVGEQSPVVWDEVFLDTASRTSVVLARIVLDDMGVRPRYTPMPSEEGVAKAVGTKGALVIGDRAFDVRKNQVLDLGREWSRLTGLPFLFAVWAARPGVLQPEDVHELMRAAAHGLGVRTELAQRFARERGDDPERYRRYLTQRIRYAVGPYELQGVEAFLAKAAEKGFLPPTKLRFADDHLRTVRTRRVVSLETALQKGADGERLDADEAELLDEKAPILELGLAADLRRRVLHADGVVTYIVSRNVNYTNVCTTACHFCAFYRPRGHAEAYVLGRDELARKIDETVALGGIEILLQGGLHPDLGIEWYEELFRWVKARWPDDQPARPLPRGDLAHRADERARAGRHHRTARRVRARLDPGRRRRGARRRGAPAHRAAQVLDRRVAHRDAGRAREGAPEHRHAHVRRRRGGASPREPPLAAARAAGPRRAGSPPSSAGPSSP